MTKIQSIITTIMMTCLLFMGMDGDGYIHKLGLFWAGVLFAMLFLTAWMEWRGLDQ